ncbi:universal stress protein [Pseudonocardia acidicola]|uniref:Universal stress protein n=1 Tax=Pseudonocardia acidicola TaxID=2724939 RepID=A0ABX1SGL8_9PSEU|nr:universal stress protein [Pseudonocardia acidicola]NMH99298.1 universal stress protein [Pseudonocardia acidicola]
MTETQEARDQPAVVVGVDGSEPSRSALRWAVRYAKAMGETVHAVIAWEPPVMFGLEMPVGIDTDFAADAFSVLKETVDTVLGPTPEVKVRTSVFEGYPPLVLVREAQDADVLAVGNRGRNTVAGITLGSVSLYCVAHARCPVVVAHKAQDENRGRSPW